MESSTRTEYAVRYKTSDNIIPITESTGRRLSKEPDGEHLELLLRTVTTITTTATSEWKTRSNV